MHNKIPKIYYFINEYNLTDLKKLSKNINLIYRNYQKKVSYKELLSIKKFCKLTKRKLFISNYIKLALSLKLDGIYIPSFNKKINYLSSFSFVHAYSHLHAYARTHARTCEPQYKPVTAFTCDTSFTQ